MAINLIDKDKLEAALQSEANIIKTKLNLSSSNKLTFDLTNGTGFKQYINNISTGGVSKSFKTKEITLNTSGSFTTSVDTGLPSAYITDLIGFSLSGGSNFAIARYSYAFFVKNSGSSGTVTYIINKTNSSSPDKVVTHSFNFTVPNNINITVGDPSDGAMFFGDYTMKVYYLE